MIIQKKECILLQYVQKIDNVHYPELNLWASTPTIPKIISTLKTLITKKIGYSIFQRNYYEHIIRNEKEYLKILEYIQNNPITWEEDKFNC